MKILMVCLGNICRSPMAEGIMKSKIENYGLDWTVASAGTNSYHTGQAPHRFSQQVCLSNGINISSQRARRFTRKDFADFDIIYAMAGDVYEEILSLSRNDEETNKVKFFLNELRPEGNESVPDPWFGDEDGYAPVYELIERTCEAIIKKYSSLQSHV